MIRRLLCCLFLTPALLAQESLFRLAPEPTHADDRSAIEATALFSMPAPGGFLPVRISASNDRKSDASISISATSEVGDDSRMRSEFQIGLPAGETVDRDLLVPLGTALLMGGEIQSALNVSVSGSYGRIHGNLSGEWSSSMPAVLMSEPLFTPNSGALDKQVNTSGSGYGSYVFAASFDPNRMPGDWRAYAGYDLAMLTDADWLALAPSARTAMLEWCRLGGKIRIFRIGGSPATFESLGIEVATVTASGDYGLGTVALDSVPADLLLDASAIVSQLRSGPESRIKSLDNDYSTRWPLHVKFGARAFEYGLFVFVLIAFGVLVGPVNLFVFAKSGRRHRLFITTPIISLATCLLLLGLILMRDGVGGRGERLALIEVQPDENRAYVHQEQVTRTGVLLRSGFTLTEDAVVSPVPMAYGPWTRLHSGEGGGDLEYTAAFTDDGLKLTGDWFRSRSEQGQVIEAVVPTRGRIELRSAEGETPVLFSTFDFPVETIYYTDRSKNRWVARNLETGKPVQASPMPDAGWKAEIKEIGARFGARHQRMLGGATTDRFFAITTQAPALETFTAIRWQETTTVLTGPVIR
ncbi:hypothetical protein [Haloferula sargassicola]|uniref:Uncharacterized protein n=1 Tax=Haloferula sargassicola TaxID=490096 RepID=A0ABP9UPV1_9BACT